MSFYKRGDDYADNHKIQMTDPGLYGYKIVKTEVGKTKGAKPKDRMTIDIELFDATSGAPIEKEIKYIQFMYKDKNGEKMLNTLLLTLGVSELVKASDLVGKKGYVLCGYEQDYQDSSKIFMKPAFGGFGCWLSPDKKTAKEIIDGEGEGGYMERMSELLQSPVRLQSGATCSLEDWQEKKAQKPAQVPAAAEGQPVPPEDMMGF